MKAGPAEQSSDGRGQQVWLWCDRIAGRFRIAGETTVNEAKESSQTWSSGQLEVKLSAFPYLPRLPGKIADQVDMLIGQTIRTSAAVKDIMDTMGAVDVPINTLSQPATAR